MGALGCVPARVEDRNGVPFDPPDLSIYVEVMCDGCTMPVLIGPNQQAMKRAHPDIECLCPYCCMRAGLLNPETQILNLEDIMNPEGRASEDHDNGERPEAGPRD